CHATRAPACESKRTKRRASSGLRKFIREFSPKLGRSTGFGLPCGRKGCANFKGSTGTENDLRRMRVVAVAAVMGAAGLAYSLPRVRAQNSSTSNAAGAGATAAGAGGKGPRLVAQGSLVRG